MDSKGHLKKSHLFLRTPDIGLPTPSGLLKIPSRRTSQAHLRSRLLVSEIPPVLRLFSMNFLFATTSKVLLRTFGNSIEIDHKYDRTP